MRLTRLALATSLCCAAASPAAYADDAALQAEVAALRAEVAELRGVVNSIQTHRAPAPPVLTAAPVYPSALPASANAPGASAAVISQSGVVASNGGAPVGSGVGLGEGTTLWGYGQLDYNHPTAHPADAQADLTRAVLGFNHVFNDSTRVYGELEWEHAVTSNVDAGESEVEQLYVEHSLSQDYGVRVGLMLVPLGLLNEHHEPSNYYGVERNLVEQAIIPTTWREGALAAYGSTDSGFNWNVGIGTGPNLGAWDPTSVEGRASPLGSIHQELQLARAHDPSIFAAVNWQGVPGLTLGGGLFTGKIGQATSQASGDDAAARLFPADNARLFLGEAHVRWQPGPFDFSALYTRGTISDTQALNLTFLGLPTPVPKAFWGGYGQAAWRALQWSAESSLVPFVRYEMLNTGAEYASQPYGLGTPALPTQRIWTVGANYYLNPNIVFKVDYQDFKYEDVALGYGSRFDLGLGYQF